MSLRLCNTLTGKIEPFEPIDSNVVRMYVCGPTVYDAAHLGHAMSAISFDIVRRYLEYKGYHVIHVMNFTDVNDKIVKRALEQDTTPQALSQRYIQEWFELTNRLNLVPAHHYPTVSQTIPEIINMIDELIDRGYAYELEGDVYFRIARFPEYGALSGRSLSNVMAGTRIDVDLRKEDPADFALWKSATTDEIAWSSPWGKGRPGWHSELSSD